MMAKAKKLGSFSSFIGASLALGQKVDERLGEFHWDCINCLFHLGLILTENKALFPPTQVYASFSEATSPRKEAT